LLLSALLARDRSIAARTVLQVRRRSAAIAGSVTLRADGGGSIQTCFLSEKNKSAFTCQRTLTTWHCPRSLAAAAAIDRYLLLAGPTAANQQQPADTVPFHRACIACEGSASNNL